MLLVVVIMVFLRDEFFEMSRQSALTFVRRKNERSLFILELNSARRESEDERERGKDVFQDQKMMTVAQTRLNIDSFLLKANVGL